MSDRLDVVVYGATGFTGTFIVERMIKSKLFEDLSIAVAGRNEKKLREVLRIVGEKTGKDTNKIAVLIADSSSEASLNQMARQAKVIINAVGPYHLYGEAVVKAAVENGASHVDISGEPAWMEKMELKYSKQAKELGVYVVSACGWDSIPADLGVNFLKKNFHGDLNHVESFVQLHSGPIRYALNTGTYETVLLAVSNQNENEMKEIRKSTMPNDIEKGRVMPPRRGVVWKIEEKELQGFAIPFPGADLSVMVRSQYYDAIVRKSRPVHLSSYFQLETRFKTYRLILWGAITCAFALASFTRQILLKYPGQCSFQMFKKSGPSAQQIAEASFTYWFFGYGYKESLPLDQQHEGKVDRKVVATCKGPDLAYMAASGCVLSAALALVKDKNNLPKEGGVCTPAAAFGDTKIYDYLASFGINFQLESEYDL